MSTFRKVKFFFAVDNYFYLSICLVLVVLDLLCCVGYSLVVCGLLIAVLLLWHTLGFSLILRTRVTLCSKMKVSSFQVCPRNPLSQPRGAPW